MKVENTVTKRFREWKRSAPLAVVTVGALLLSVPPAAAVSHVTIQSGGTAVGVGTTATLSGGRPNVEQAVIATNGVQTQRFLVPTDSQGVGSFWWTPSSYGTWTLALDNGSGGDVGRQQVFVTATTSKTYLSAPSTVRVGETFTLRATVVTQMGSRHPAEGVVFLTAGSKIIGRSTLKRGVPSSATFRLRPRLSGHATDFTAVYVPQGAGGAADVDCATACASAPVSVQVVKNQVQVALQLPVPATQDSRTSVQVRTWPGATVSLQSTQGAIGSATASKSGLATIAWVPKVTGDAVLTATATWPDGTLHSAGRTVRVEKGAAVDTLVLDPVGPRAALTPLGANVMANGRSLTLRAYAASGAKVAVRLASGSACTLIDMVLTATSATGSCTIHAHSAGGWGYVAANQEYRMLLAPAQH